MKCITKFFKKKKTVELSKDNPFPDISRYRICDFNKFKGTELIFKATEGDTWLDPTFNKNASECINKKINFGCYHFYRVGISHIDQLNNYFRAMGELIDYMHFPPIVDYEKANNQNLADLIRGMDNLYLFCSLIKKETGKKVMIYTGEYLLNRLPFDDRFLNVCEKPWVANYSKKPTKFGPWDNGYIWQYTDKERIKGINKPCDGNVYL